MTLLDLIADLIHPGYEIEAEDVPSELLQATRMELAKLLRGTPRQQKVGQALVAKYIQGKVSREKERQKVAKGWRLLRGALRKLLSTVKANNLQPRGAVPYRPRGPWISIREAAITTGYDDEHIRAWVLQEHPEVRHRKIGGQIYVHRDDIVAYARYQRRRGYGPKG